VITGGRVPVATGVDPAMMYAAHAAFARDLDRIASAAVGSDVFAAPTRATWHRLEQQLHRHHAAEDAALWPALRDCPLDPDEIAVLDAMELEHARIEVALERVDNAFADCRQDQLAAGLRALSEALADHLRHEEEAALPLVVTHLGTGGWDAFVREARSRQRGLRGAASYLDWLLDGAPDATRRRVLSTLPAPVRWVYSAKTRSQRAPTVRR
jgi:hypothetical protein